MDLDRNAVTQDTWELSLALLQYDQATVTQATREGADVPTYNIGVGCAQCPQCEYWHVYVVVTLSAGKRQLVWRSDLQLSSKAAGDEYGVAVFRAAADIINRVSSETIICDIQIPHYN